MKAIILAAGEGKRLRPLTNDRPKCMVEYNKKPIIDYILEVMKECSIDNIAIVNGYKKDILSAYLDTKGITTYTNINYDKTNMVSTLFCAEEFMNDDLIISYADIIYTKEILKKLIVSDDDFSVVVDKEWKELWQIRMDNPLDDAETLKIENGKIIEIGKVPHSYNEIDGQYIGLIKISKKVINEVIAFYKNLNRDDMYDGKDFNNMYMTSFIQLIIDFLIDAKPVIVEGGWIEVDTLSDLSAYEDKKWENY
ncbi:MAG: NTP transferase domain-containing protein [Helicobacteraceae bacterium]|nr:NTP transferase domain-containing protein [Helicobacteraceae bacterium]